MLRSMTSIVNNINSIISVESNIKLVNNYLFNKLILCNE